MQDLLTVWEPKAYFKKAGSQRQVGFFSFFFIKFQICLIFQVFLFELAVLFTKKNQKSSFYNIRGKPIWVGFVKIIYKNSCFYATSLPKAFCAISKVSFSSTRWIDWERTFSLFINFSVLNIAYFHVSFIDAPWNINSRNFCFRKIEFLFQLTEVSIVEHVEGDPSRFGLRLGTVASNDNRTDLKASTEQTKVAWVKKIRELTQGMLPLGRRSSYIF